MIPSLQLPLVALLLMLAGAWLVLRASAQRRATGMPAGQVVYVDTGDWRRNDRPLYSSRHGLAGKPDYLVATNGQTIPVEVKSTQLAGQEPYDSHKLQLAAYCLLVEEVFHSRPSHGILKYADVAIRLPYTSALRSELLATLAQMRAGSGMRSLPRSHDDPQRCTRCGFKHACDQALAR